MFAQAVRDGLGQDGQKSLPPTYLYDALGSTLFDAITLLPEYGVTRAEERVLIRHAARIATQVRASTPRTKALRVVELGSGSGRKTRTLLQALTREGPVHYTPIDVSGAALAQCAQALSDLPGVTIQPFEGDYLDGLTQIGRERAQADRGEPSHRQTSGQDGQPEDASHEKAAVALHEAQGDVSARLARDLRGAPMLVLFLGSTIGNFPRLAAQRFMMALRSGMRAGDALLLGTDLLKPIDTLLHAYDDPTGVTAAFNLNVLGRINRELQGDFVLPSFEHVARFNPQARSVEMHLRAKTRQRVNVAAASLQAAFLEGETIWTESSHKYLPDEVVRMGRDARYDVVDQWTDETWPFAETLMAVH
ncbi:L-histidine N(alpha)-methyltransferase [Robbsia sp. KACC 23696]|uniref:L-histidine N(alpha)-methyltransferase n=1 Tax=Robbsia sp. KACC 23696 TaxID=3149231 RepID=UPI00325B780B